MVVALLGSLVAVGPLGSLAEVEPLDSPVVGEPLDIPGLCADFSRAVSDTLVPRTMEALRQGDRAEGGGGHER